MAKTKKLTTKNNTLLRRIGLMIGKFFLWFLAISTLWVLAYRFINPPITLLMIKRSVEGKSNDNNKKVKRKWVKFEDISDNMKRAAVAAEDQLFLQHIGFDMKAIEKAFENNSKGKKIKGGSTISQQTAKNVFLWPGRSYVRKAFEAYFTLLIEILWSKERILEVYLNSIEMGNGIYGAEAAAQHWFRKPAAKLSASEAASIAAILPNPRKYKAVNSSGYIQKRKNWILRQMNYYGPLTFD